VSLPLARRRVSAVAEPDTLADLRGMRILLVDDDETSLRMLRTALSRCGAEVETADCVAAARAALAERRPDLIITDVAMPEEDGMALLREVRRSERLAGVPVFALTAFHQDDVAEKEFDALLRKPIDPLELARRVARTRNVNGAGSSTSP
jgi:CheY-like chemotaxis protein